MATSFSPSQLERFRREAKKLGRELSIPHHEALDRIAARHSFQNWSLLTKRSEAAPAPHLPLQSPEWAQAPDELVERYYLHGDIVVDDPTQCYCARCDLFVDLSHFDAARWHQDGEDGPRFLAALERHNALPPAAKAKRGRPDDASNVLAGPALEERAVFHATRSPFHKWLEGQRSRRDIVGDLAGDILGDKAFPVGLSTRKDVETHMSSHGDHIVRAIRAAWRDFEGSRQLAT